MTRAEFIREIVSSRPPGYFDHAQPLLERLADLQLESCRLWVQLHAVEPGTRASLALTEKMLPIIEEKCQLLDALHLGPQNRGLPPPRLQ